MRCHVEHLRFRYQTGAETFLRSADGINYRRRREQEEFYHIRFWGWGM
jgi:hypothetical protein